MKLVPTEDGKVEVVVTDIDDDDDIIEENEDEEKEASDYYNYKAPPSEIPTDETPKSESKGTEDIPDDTKTSKTKFDPNDERFYVQ